MFQAIIDHPPTLVLGHGSLGKGWVITDQGIPIAYDSTGKEQCRQHCFVLQQDYRFHRSESRTPPALQPLQARSQARKQAVTLLFTPEVLNRLVPWEQYDLHRQVPSDMRWASAGLARVNRQTSATRYFMTKTPLGSLTSGVMPDSERLCKMGVDGID